MVKKTKRYRALVDLWYPNPNGDGEKHVAAGDDASDIPASSVPHEIEANHIEEAAYDDV